MLFIRNDPGGNCWKPAMDPAKTDNRKNGPGTDAGLKTIFCIRRAPSLYFSGGPDLPDILGAAQERLFPAERQFF